MKQHLLLAALLLSCAVPLRAQTDVALDAEAGARLALSVDKKLAKGLHLSLEEEVRFDNNFASFDRFHTTLGLTYKAAPWLKLGVGYALINGYSTSSQAFKSARHRLMADATGSVTFGLWRLSLRERVQATVRTGSFNEYQNPSTEVALKSRLKLQYRGLRRWTPYGAVELRNTFSAPVVSATYNEATGLWGYYSGGSFAQYGNEGWFLDGFNGAALNRVRCSLGTDYRLSKRSSLEFALMADYSIDKEVDANAEGTRLKSYTIERGWTLWMTAAYNYSF